MLPVVLFLAVVSIGSLVSPSVLFSLRAAVALLYEAYVVWDYFLRTLLLVEPNAEEPPAACPAESAATVARTDLLLFAGRATGVVIEVDF